MKNLMSELFKQAEKFLVINSNNEAIKDVHQQILLLGEFDKRELDDHFVHTFAGMKNRIDGGKIDTDYYKDLCAFYQTEKDYLINRSNISGFSASVLKIIETPTANTLRSC